MMRVYQSETNLDQEQREQIEQIDDLETKRYRCCLLSSVGITIVLFIVLALFINLTKHNQKILIKRLNTQSNQHQNLSFDSHKSITDYFQLPPNVWRTQQEYNKIIVEYKYKFQKHFIYFSDKYAANKRLPFMEFGFDDHIQLASQFDYLNLTKSSQFKQLEEQWHKILPHEVFSFPFNQQLERSQGLINTTGRFNDINTSIALIYQLAVKEKMGCENKPMEACLAIILNKLKDNQDVKQIQYEIMNNNFQIGSIKDQSSICIVSPGYKAASLNNYQETFNSLERLNYTNFKFVIVDDNSPDQSVETFYKYFNESSMRLKNRVTIVRNIVKVGMTGNLYLKIKQFCSGFDIVVNMDLDDALFGYQTLKVVNAIYQNPQIWISFSELIQQWIGTNLQWSTLVRPIQKVNNDNYRIIEHYWFTIPLRSSRYALNAKLPLYHMVEYVYNKFTGYLEPTFYQSSSDRFYEYSLFEMASQKRTKKVGVFLYDYKVFSIPNAKKCYRQFEYYCQYKARAKTPLKNLLDLNSQPELFSNRFPSKSVLQSLRFYLKNYRKCKTEIKITYKLILQKFPYSPGFENQQLLPSQQLFQQVRTRLSCSQLTLLTKQKQINTINHTNIDININFLTMDEVAKSVQGSNLFSKFNSNVKSKSHCIVTKDFQINSLIFYYQQFSSLLIETTIYNVLVYDVATFIGNQKLFERLSISKFELGEKTFLKLTAI